MMTVPRLLLLLTMIPIAWVYGDKIVKWVWSAVSFTGSAAGSMIAKTFFDGVATVPSSGGELVVKIIMFVLAMILMWLTLTMMGMTLGFLSPVSQMFSATRAVRRMQWLISEVLIVVVFFVAFAAADSMRDVHAPPMVVDERPAADKTNKTPEPEPEAKPTEKASPPPSKLTSPPAVDTREAEIQRQLQQQQQIEQERQQAESARRQTECVTAMRELEREKDSIMAAIKAKKDIDIANTRARGYDATTLYNAIRAIEIKYGEQERRALRVYEVNLESEPKCKGVFNNK